MVLMDIGRPVLTGDGVASGDTLLVVLMDIWRPALTRDGLLGSKSRLVIDMRILAAQHLLSDLVKGRNPLLTRPARTNPITGYRAEIKLVRIKPSALEGASH
jgi:hypothetical protein